MSRRLRQRRGQPLRPQVRTYRKDGVYRYTYRDKGREHDGLTKDGWQWIKWG